MEDTDIKPEHVKEFEKHARALAQLMGKIQKYAPDVNLFADESYNLNLMKGETHRGESDEIADSCPENVVASVMIPGLGGGCWA